MEIIFPGKSDKTGEVKPRKVGRPSNYDKALKEGKDNPEQYITEYMKYTHGLGYTKPGYCAFCGTQLTILSTLKIGFRKSCRRCYNMSPLGIAEKRRKRLESQENRESGDNESSGST